MNSLGLMLKSGVMVGCWGVLFSVFFFIGRFLSIVCLLSWRWLRFFIEDGYVRRCILRFGGLG